MATWLLPDNIADILPHQARTVEAMRRKCLDLFALNGFELVQPPLIEFVDSLLTGSGSDVDNNTFKFMDQGSGRMVGVRADPTPQIARIDAHILNRQQVSRLCYAGSCLHARPMHPLASREPIVTGAELFGVSGWEADAQMLSLAVKTLRVLGIKNVQVDLGHVGLVRALLAGQSLTGDELHAILRALRMKDPVALERAASKLPLVSRHGLRVLIENFGDASVLARLKQELPQDEAIAKALEDVEKIATRSGADTVSFDFGDVHGYQYLTGISFSVHIPQYAQAILRGGRYDDIGSAFGRSRPACGFTIYLRALAGVTDLESPVPEAVVAAGDYDPELEKAVDALRAKGYLVVRLLPGESDASVAEHFRVTQALVRTEEGFTLQAC